MQIVSRSLQPVEGRRGQGWKVAIDHSLRRPGCCALIEMMMKRCNQTGQCRLRRDLPRRQKLCRCQKRLDDLLRRMMWSESSTGAFSAAAVRLVAVERPAPETVMHLSGVSRQVACAWRCVWSVGCYLHLCRFHAATQSGENTLR